MLEHDSITLMQQTAQKSDVENLYQHGFIDQRGKILALDLLEPSLSWGFWTAYLLNILGYTLILVGLVFFFSFNWQHMTPQHKFSTIELALFCCILGNWVYGANRLTSQLFLTSACVLVGIFLAVFGQIYQTGADAFQLFFLWGVLIAPWVLISQFLPLCIIWLVIILFAADLTWQQWIVPSFQQNDLVYLLNAGILGLFLLLRECWSPKYMWLQPNWSRLVLIFALVMTTLIPVELALLLKGFETIWSVLIAITAMLAQILLLNLYTFWRPDLKGCTMILLSGCIIIVSFLFKLLNESTLSAPIVWFLMTCFIIIVFGGASILLKKISHHRLFGRQVHL